MDLTHKQLSAAREVLSARTRLTKAEMLAAEAEMLLSRAEEQMYSAFAEVVKLPALPIAGLPTCQWDLTMESLLDMARPYLGDPT